MADHVLQSDCTHDVLGSLKFAEAAFSLDGKGIAAEYGGGHSTVTDFARFFGLSMSQPFSFAT